MENEVRLERVPPQDIDAERAVLGAMMFLDGGKDAILKCSRLLGSGEGSVFYREAHQKIYAAIISLNSHDEPVDLVTMTDKLQATNDLEKIGGVEYLDDLIDSTPTAANAIYYAKIVKDLATRRAMIYNSSVIYNEAFDATIDVNQLLGNVNNIVNNLNADSTQEPEERPDIKSGLDTLFRELQNEPDHGVPSGFLDLDRNIFGFPRGTVNLVAGCTSIGKSAFVQNIVQNNMDDYWTLYFSTEMSKRLLQKRFLASETGITTHQLEKRGFDEHMWSKLTLAAGRLAGSKVMIFDNMRSTSDIHNTIKWYKNMGKADLVVIDHLGHLNPTQMGGKRVEVVSYISNEIHDMAVIEDVPIIAISHLKRLNRADKHPTLFDLRDAGTLENDADRVMFLYREDYNGFGNGAANPWGNNVTEVIVAKDRIYGNTGTVELAFVNNRYQNLKKEGDDE